MEEELEKREKKMPVWDPQKEAEARRHYRKGLLAGVGYTLVILAAVAAGILWARQDIEKKKGVYRPGAGVLTEDFMEEVCRVYAQIDQTFLYEYDIKKMQDGMLEGMLKALDDPYSAYYNESALESFTAQTEGEYYGIGCMVSQDKLTGVVTIVKPYTGSPAMEAGILPGDILCAVNDTEITEMDLDQVVAMIKGAEGTTVRLSVEREGEGRLLFDVERRQVEVNTVEHEMLEGEIGYIAVSSFDGVTPAQFKTAFEELKQQGMKGLVIDMRSNGGGLLSAVEEMLDYMLPEGVIFYAKDKKGNKYLEYASDESAALDVPLAVLINGNTASAAEVFSGNIQDFGVGTLVGTTTFGKGIMQNTYTTNSQGTRAIKLTVADYYIHSGRNIHGTGLEPDVAVELEEALRGKAIVEKEEDNQLQEALRVVREQLP